MRIGVAGAGVMGTGVAQCFAAAGHDVLVADPDPAALAGAPDRVRQGLRLRALAGRPVTGPADVLERIRWTSRIGGLTDVRFVVECVPERTGVKEQVFRELDHVCPPGTVLASCTSAIPIGTLAALTRRPDAVIGTHFMNPAPLKDTVEVVRAGGTSEETLSRTVDLLAGIGKKAIVVGDGPGFVANRVLMVMVNQAVTALQDGIADALTVDEIFQSCAGHAMGPLRTADLIGLDTVLDTLRVLRDRTGDPVFQPRPLLVELVRQGRLGRKSGRGFHEYPVR
ncbi:MAG TPA: 3-hydroxyacyl-CoA dehydrogenase family protein [Pseudonocardiaceae bacterium]|nr:3-hydroxyacyl-CoA dehydrogenase family protein [Pseudonocardiaceae bacterium]